MHVLVTGAGGFLGGHVVRMLAERGDTVMAHGGRRDGDLADAHAAKELLAPGFDAIVNLAGPVTSGNEDLATGMEVVAAHARIALHIRRHAGTARIVHASSMTVYGMPERVDVDEDHPRRPMHLYGLAKLVAEDVLLTSDANVAVLRLPGLFSEERKAGALFHWCRAARAGESIRVSTPTPTPWNILHVADAADAIVHAVHAQPTGAFNISYGEPIELVSVARMIAARTGVTVEHPGVPHPPMNLVNTKARSLGWNAPALSARLARLYDDYAAA